jgi:dUTPase
VTATIALKVLDERIRHYLPSYATPGSAGMDLRACIDAPLTLAAGQAELIPTGVAPVGQQCRTAVERLACRVPPS